MASRRVQVEYYGLVKAAAGTGEESVEVPEGASIRDLIDILGERHGAGFAANLVPRGPSARNVMIQVDGENVGQADCLDVKLNGHGRVTFVVTVTQMSGG